MAEFVAELDEFDRLGIQPKIYVEEADIEPKDTVGIAEKFVIILPRNAPLRLKRLLLLHELVEAVTGGSHIIASFWEFVADPVLFLRWRMRIVDPTALFWLFVLLAGLIVWVVGSVELVILAVLVYAMFAVMIVMTWPIYKWALQKTEEVLEHGQ